MVSNFKFKDCNEKRKVIEYLEGNSECNMDRYEKFRLKNKSVHFSVKNGELFFLKTKHLADNLFSNIKEKDIATFIAECPQCQKSYGFTTVTKIRPIVTIHIRERYMADCISLLEYQNVNWGYKYILNIIDCYLKFMWVAKLKNKNAITMRGNMNVSMVHKRPRQSQGQVERANQTLKSFSRMQWILFVSGYYNGVHNCILKREMKILDIEEQD
ncbi:hypothetical protein A3Q56_01563 [Intoshia linei]|uniref:Integrase catalytic domain-containing protein n=1 Tax=Intoshia linei TaxID=1819745 RepID=A0A177B8V9_9BILA|nr:hypothetical protein A3Q56_01563 [Intoshia linei]